jgi:phosphoglycolate phosphatase
MQTRNILFDLDGTLIDSLPGIEFSVDCALAQCGMPPRHRELRPLIGPPIRSIFSQLLDGPPEDRLSALEQAFRSSYDETGWSKTVPADFAIDTLRAFHDAGLRLFLVTNKPSTPTAQIVEHLRIGPLFSEILCRNSRTPPFASKADMLRHLIRVHQLEPGECLYVGDTSEDYRAAEEVGLPVAIVAYGYGEPNTTHGECIHLDNLSELLTIVETMEMS